MSGTVAGDERVEDFADRGLLGGVEEPRGLESETQCLVVGQAGIIAEDKSIGGARKGNGQAP